MMSWIVDIIEESEDASLKRPKSGGEILAIIDKYIAQSDQIDGDDLLEGFKQALLKG